MKILIIDDEYMIRLTTDILLTQNGCEVLCAINGQEGLIIAEKEQPDLILLDIMMPIMDGWEVYDKLQKNKLTSQIDIIIFTASDFTTAQIKATERNITRIIRKPFSIDHLLDMCGLNRKKINE